MHLKHAQEFFHSGHDPESLLLPPLEPQSPFPPELAPHASPPPELGYGFESPQAAPADESPQSATGAFDSVAGWSPQAAPPPELSTGASPQDGASYFYSPQAAPSIGASPQLAPPPSPISTFSPPSDYFCFASNSHNAWISSYFFQCTSSAVVNFGSLKCLTNFQYSIVEKFSL